MNLRLDGNLDLHPEQFMSALRVYAGLLFTILGVIYWLDGQVFLTVSYIALGVVQAGWYIATWDDTDRDESAQYGLREYVAVAVALVVTLVLPVALIVVL